MTLEEFSNLVQGKWVAAKMSDGSDRYVPTLCHGVIEIGDTLASVVMFGSGTLSFARVSAYQTEFWHPNEASCQIECDRLNKPDDEYEEGADEEETEEAAE